MKFENVRRVLMIARKDQVRLLAESRHRALSGEVCGKNPTYSIPMGP